LSKIVQIVQLVHKGRFKITHKNCGVSGLLSLAQLLLAYELESELTRIPVVVSWVVAIASVALPKRECGRSLKPRKKRGVWECAQWSKGRGRLVGGWVGVPAKLGSVLTANPQIP